MVTAGTRLGPYTITEALGHGGMGEVYRARDTRLGRDVAIKVLSKELSATAEHRARFESEARMVSSLKHPHVCTLYDVGREGDADYLVMELIEGETLAARLERGPLPTDRLIDAAIQIAGALGHAHEAGLVHRDLKPGNVMLTDSGVKLLDFGLARPASSRAIDPSNSQSPTLNAPMTAVGVLIGTIPYMAPEQLEGKEADARTDVFALGCVLYEMASGRRPFRGADTASIIGSILRDTPEPLTGLDESTPRALERIVFRCLEKDPAKRYATAAEVGEELARLKSWARNEGLPELARIADRILMLEEGPDSWAAFLLAREIEKLVPDDPLLAKLKPDFSNPITIVTDPPGASVSARYYGAPEGESLMLGQTPLEAIRYPRGFTRLELELPGHRTLHDLIWNVSKLVSNATDAENAIWRYTLRRPGEIPDEMEEVPAGEFTLYMPGLDHLAMEPTAAFLIDRDPVTNREFKRFVDDGGYQREELWREPFVESGRTLPWLEAIARFTDAVGRPGPATWEMGDYPAGEDEHPVAGISWYEASAYAAWAGKELPTIFHWNRVAFPAACSQIAPLSNFSGRGVVPVGATPSMNRYGVRDLSGNVREWVRNQVSHSGHRFILGGGWNDPEYAFVDACAQPAFDRSPSNGFRCIRALEADPNAANLERAIEIPFRDFATERPVSDEMFGFFLRQFHYDKKPVEAIVSSDQESPLGRWQSIQIDAPYGREKMTLHVLLPTRGQPPFQTVVLFPGSNAIHTRVFELSELRRVEFVVRSGRALILPVYKGTYERGGELKSDYPAETAHYRDHVIMWGKEIARTVDFVESRDDLDAERVAYFGTSWGGALGAILPAVEPRFKAVLLYVAGFCFQRALPEADQIHYAPRVTQPTLMLNGELDFFFPIETSQRPMFELLGAPAEHKRWLTYPRGHTVPKTELIKETLAWLDRYLGPVR
jgi:serine/threonine protein kinase/predicted esterase